MSASTVYLCNPKDGKLVEMQLTQTSWAWFSFGLQIFIIGYTSMHMKGKAKLPE